MKAAFFCLFSLGLLLASAFAFAKEPVNIATCKQALVHYHDSGQYEKDIASVINDAMHYLHTRLAHPSHDHKKPAIVLDIDETALSNYVTMTTLGFGGTLEEIRQAENRGVDPVIAPTLKLYHDAIAHHVAVFFITGRYEYERPSTVKNLQKAGYTNWNDLIFRSHKYEHAKPSVYKTAMRKQLVQQGYDIIENIGDQQSDLVNGYADRTFKLPNPFYLVS